MSVATQMAAFSHRSLAALRDMHHSLICDLGDYLDLALDLDEASDDLLDEIILRFYQHATKLRAQQSLEGWIDAVCKADDHEADIGYVELNGAMKAAIAEVVAARR
jgi:hypothetical protein